MRINHLTQEHNTIRMTLAGPRPRPFDTGTKEQTSEPLCLQYILSPLVVQRDSILTSALDDYIASQNCHRASITNRAILFLF